MTNGSSASAFANMFTLEDRKHAHDVVLSLAQADDRIVAGALVGSLVSGGGDQWSDLDLTFAVRDGTPVLTVLEEWTRALAEKLDAIHLFDVESGPATYRVFLLSGCLQLDVSLTPVARFGARGPRFQLLFGQRGEPPDSAPPAVHELLGMAAHHALRARVCIERDRPWQAAHWIAATRDAALSLCCLRHGLPHTHGRGLDALPAAVHDVYAGSFVARLEREALLSNLRVCLRGLRAEAMALGATALAARLDDLDDA